MPEKDLAEAARQSAPWLTTFVLSIWAGVVQYIQKLRAGQRFKWRELCFDLLICSFVGMLTRMLCTWAHLDEDLSTILIAISAHMGTRALIAYEGFRNRIFTAPVGEGK